MKHPVDTPVRTSVRRSPSLALGVLLLSAVNMSHAQADAVRNLPDGLKENPHGAVLLPQADHTQAGGADVRRWRERVYGWLAQGRQQEALEAAEQAYRLDPSDQQIALQRAYLLDTAGHIRLATEAFRSLTRSGDPTIAGVACRAWQTLRGQPDRVLPRPWFAEVYAAPEHVSRYRLGVFPWAVRFGKRLGGDAQPEVYGSVRVTTDTRSGETALGPQIYNDNAAIAAAGLRLRPVANWPLQSFLELGLAHDLIDRQRDRTRGDLRGGLVFYQNWNNAPRCAREAGGGLHLLADVYADAIYHSRYRHAALFNVRARPGVRLAESGSFALDAYVLLAAGSDTRRGAQNRYSELGSGLAVTVFEPWRLNVRAESVRVLRHDNKSRYHTGRLRLEYAATF